MRHQKTWSVPASSFGTNTFNPIRSIIENMHINPNPEKPMIALSIGDPTVFGNLKPAKEVTDAVINSITEGKYNGYGPSTGYLESREAVAKYCSTPEAPLKAQDIILCSGCSCALDISIMALCSPGQNILVPRPGFPLYQTLAEGVGVSVKYYDLLPERNWEVDLKMLDEMVDDSTAAIVVNNPSNPCGSVFPKEHLREILHVAERNKVPVIADEIYDNFVFEGQEFHWMASLTTEVPVLSCGGLTKRFLVPGWRMGWIAIHDKNAVLGQQVRKGLQNLSQRIIGSNTLVQGALPVILANTPPSFFTDTIRVVQRNATLSYTMLNNTKGLTPVMPQGAMYMMVRISMEHFPQFENDLQLVEKMIAEESVFCLPGKCFNVSNFFRVVLTVPDEQMKEACQRIQQFCLRHYQPSAITSQVPLTSLNVLDHSNGHHQNGNGISGDTNGTSGNSNDQNGNGISNHASPMETDVNVTMEAKASAILKRDLLTAQMDGE